MIHKTDTPQKRAAQLAAQGNYNAALHEIEDIHDTYTDKLRDTIRYDQRGSIFIDEDDAVLSGWDRLDAETDALLEEIEAIDAPHSITERIRHSLSSLRN